MAASARRPSAPDGRQRPMAVSGSVLSRPVTRLAEYR
jgi:hypothetical protein